MRKLQCRICGFKSHTLAEHVKKAHNLEPAVYEKTYKHKLVSYAKAVGKRREVIYPPNGVEVPNITDLKENKKVIDPDLFLPDMKMREELIKCIQHGDNVMLVGPTGCGKTTLLKKLAQEILPDNANLFCTKLHEEVTVQDVVGHAIVMPDRLLGFGYGILPLAMNPKSCGRKDIENGWLLVDEFDGGSSRAQFAFMGILEPDRKLFILENGEEITATKDFRFMATANTKGCDENGRYIRNHIDAALYDRLTIFECDYSPHEKTLLIQKVGVDEKTADKMMEVTKATREAFKNEQVESQISTRRLLDWAEKSKYLGLKSATQLSLINPLEVADQEIYREVIQRITGLNLAG